MGPGDPGRPLDPYVSNKQHLRICGFISESFTGLPGFPRAPGGSDSPGILMHIPDLPLLPD